MINNLVLQGDMHSDTIIWREREEPKRTELLCFIYFSCVSYSAGSLGTQSHQSCTVWWRLSGEPTKPQTLLA